MPGVPLYQSRKPKNSKRVPKLVDGNGNRKSWRMRRSKKDSKRSGEADGVYELLANRRRSSSLRGKGSTTGMIQGPVKPSESKPKSSPKDLGQTGSHQERDTLPPDWGETASGTPLPHFSSIDEGVRLRSGEKIE